MELMPPDWVERFMAASPEQKSEMVAAVEARKKAQRKREQFDCDRAELAASLMVSMEPNTWMESPEHAADFAVKAADALLKRLGVTPE